MKTVAILGTFDSKGDELYFIKDLLESTGLKTITIHSGVFAPTKNVDITNSQVASDAGANIEALAKKNDRSTAVDALARGIEILLPKLYSEGKFDGVISIGGSGGTALATPGMRKLPVGVPKVMLSTMASSENGHKYIGTSDIILMPSVVDVAGLNSISVKILANAAFAVAGMVSFENKNNVLDKKPLIAASMFGVTTPCVTAAREYLETQGYEVLVFHANGVGGRSMEDLIKAGFISGVLDLTTTEWCDQIFGGLFGAGDARCEEASISGIPTVASVGALDMINFGSEDTVPAVYKNRNIYKHNAMVTLVRTNIQENKALGEVLAQKWNMAQPNKLIVMLPLKGVSGMDKEGAQFYGVKEDKALFDAIYANVDTKKIEIINVEHHINDTEFALAAAKKLISLMSDKII